MSLSPLSGALASRDFNSLIMQINNESYDDYNLDDYEQAQEVCLNIWHESPVYDYDGTLIGWRAIDESRHHW